MDNNIFNIMMTKFNFKTEEPVLYLDFDEDSMNEGMDALSFVDKPATDIEWKKFAKLDESYDDYPNSATANACRAIKYKENNPNLDCGTQVGWTRAAQLCNRRRISVETIARMASFKRHQQNKDVPYDKGCGGIMWDAWGGTEGVEWAIRKMERINNQLRMTPFSKEEFQDINYEKRIVTAPVMLAETPILRYNPDLGKYFVKFKPETIEKMMKKYFKENKIHKVNTNHDPKSVKNGVYMMESYIVGDRNSSKLFPDLPEGSWVATFYVDNDEVWDKIKKGEYNGFSLEGYFIEKYEDDMVDKLLMEIESTLTRYVDEDLIKKRIKELLNIK
jgi:hypothetical protein